MKQKLDAMTTEQIMAIPEGTVLIYRLGDYRNGGIMIHQVDNERVVFDPAFIDSGTGGQGAYAGIVPDSPILNQGWTVYHGTVCHKSLEYHDTFVRTELPKRRELYA